MQSSTVTASHAEQAISFACAWATGPGILKTTGIRALEAARKETPENLPRPWARLLQSECGTATQGRLSVTQGEHTVSSLIGFRHEGGIQLENGRSRWGQGITPAVMKSCHWVEPVLVAQIKFTEWSSDEHLRQPVFLGLRTDKPAKDVVRE
jgi:hypothetical protein